MRSRSPKFCLGSWPTGPLRDQIPCCDEPETAQKHLYDFCRVSSLYSIRIVVPALQRVNISHRSSGSALHSRPKVENNQYFVASVVGELCRETRESMEPQDLE